MTLRDVVERRAFDDATNDERRVSVYVRHDQLHSGAARPEVQLMDALRGDSAARVHVVGPSGAGKTSMLLRVAADLHAAAPTLHHEVLLLRVGDQPARLASGEDVMKMVLETIQAQNYRFSNIDQAVFAAAAADETTRTPARIDHAVAGGASVGIASTRYQATLRDGFTVAKFGQNAAQVRQDLGDVLTEIKTKGYRPVLIIDDTEKFVAPGPGSQIDLASIENLYHHSIRALADLSDLDLVVAMHPRFDEVPRVREIAERFSIQRIEVPTLEPNAGSPPMAAILERRLTRAAIAAPLTAVISTEAVLELQTLYHARNRDLRAVLKVAHQAARDALECGEERLDGTGVLRTLAAQA